MTASKRQRVMTVVGARPQFVKAAMIARRLRLMGEAAPLEEILVHTGQHYDPMLSDVFFRELEVAPPHHNLEVGSGSPAAQISRLIERLDPVVQAEKPDVILVYGDTNSTLSAAVVAAHRNLPLVHVEAGERIYRRLHVPEEVNRIVTDNVATLCLTSTKRASSYLLREGMAPERVRFVGDPMYDLFVWGREQVQRKSTVTPATFGLEPEQYHLATIHRVQNTFPDVLVRLLETLDAAELPVILPVHPRVRELLKTIGWTPRRSLKLVEPFGYFEVMAMLLACRTCITDSGGLSREAFFARRPCIIPMPDSWWPEIIQSGWAMDTGDDPARLAEAIATFRPKNAAPEGMFGDGDSASRIIAEVATLQGATGEPPWHPHGSRDFLPKIFATNFTYETYSALLERLRAQGYTFPSLSEAGGLLERDGLFVLLRHPVDFDIEKAVRMAEVESSLGISATYFFDLRSTHYNLLSAESTALVERILSLGHRIGLSSGASEREATVVEQWFGCRVETAPALSDGRLWHASDVNGRWTPGPPEESDAFRQKRPMDLLVHPIWWNEQPAVPYETLMRYIDRRKEHLETSAAAQSAVYRVGRFARQ